jgi:hypothetical protein
MLFFDLKNHWAGKHMQKVEKMLCMINEKNTCNLYKLTYSNTRDNYSKIRVLEKVAIRSSTRVLDTRRWNHYIKALELA